MIPYDATKHIQGISAGAEAAMPSLIKAGEAKKPGSPELEGYINGKFAEFERRVSAGENPAKVTQDLMGDFEQTMRGGPGTLGYAEQQAAGSPSVGVNKGITSLGTPDMGAVTSSPPNSFGGGSFNGLTPPPSTMGGGIGGNTAPSQPATMQPNVPNTPIDAGTAVNSPTGNVVKMPDESPTPYPETPKDSIDLTARPNPMQTGHGSPIPNMRTRGEQETALSDIERMSKIDNAETALDIKREQIQFKTQLDIIKTRAKELRLSEKDRALILMSFEGLDAKKQMFVASEWARKLNNEAQNKLKADRNDIARGKAANTMPPELKMAADNYHKVAGRLEHMRSGLNGGEEYNADAIKNMFMEEVQTRKTLNELVTKYNAEHGTNFPLIKDAAMAMKDLMDSFGKE